jgi:hypothetical protein
MRRMRNGLVLVMLAICLLVSARLTLRAQERGTSDPAPREERRQGRVEPGPTDAATADSISVQDAMQRPFSFPFAEPTTLADVGEYLHRTLKAPVVLDLAALDRQDVRPEDTVQLQLEGVRLKTGLKLLLDQVGLTFHIIPEDNLLILTDTEGTTDPIDHVLTEVKALHRDVHELQDLVDDLRRSLGLDGEGGAMMRKPTIIEELPAEEKPGEKSQMKPQGSTNRPHSRPGA